MRQLANKKRKIALRLSRGAHEVMNNIQRLQVWYRQQCDGEWEHQSGINKDNDWHGAGDEAKLEEILQTFLDWADKANV